MILAMILAVLAPEGEPIVLRDRATVSGRYVRLSDLVRGEHADRLREVYLGRSPEEGLSRIVTAREIRRQMVIRGADPGEITLVGDQVEVTRVFAAEATASVRMEIEKKIIGLLAGPDAEPGDVIACVTAVLEGELPAAGTVSRVASAGRSDGSLREFTVTFSGAEDRTARVRARIRRAQVAVFAVREIPELGKITREDVVVRRVREEADSDMVGNLDSLVGGRATVRIHRGSAIRRGQVRSKPVVRAGDVVRVYGRGFETDARAVTDGRIGESLQLEYLATRNRFRAVVIDDGSVRVKEEAR